MRGITRVANVAVLSFIAVTFVQGAAIREGTPGNASYDYVGADLFNAYIQVLSLLEYTGSY